MTPKTPTEIAQEIHDLQTLRPRVRRYSMFGDDNWARIDAQVRTLQHGWTEDDLYDTWGMESEGLLNAGLDAIQWRQGEAEEGLAESWQELVTDRLYPDG